MVLILLLAFTQTEKPAESFKYYACADDSEIYNAWKILLFSSSQTSSCLFFNSQPECQFPELLFLTKTRSISSKRGAFNPYDFDPQ